MPEIPTVDSPQTTAVQTVDQKPSTNNFLVILLSVLLLLSVSIAGFFAYQTQKLVVEVTSYREQLTQTPVATTEPVATNSPIVTTDPTANWKTYTNEKYGFSFKYPREWVVEFNEKDSGFEEKNLKVSSGPYSIKFDWTSAGYGGVICKFDDTTSDEFAGPGTDKLYKPYRLGTFLGKDSRRNLDLILQLDQYGYQRNELGYTFRVCTKMDGLRSDGKSAYEGAISTKLGTLEITYETPRSNINKDSLNIIDQILSTFKFTN